jgi:hypothetical protein
VLKMPSSTHRSRTRCMRARGIACSTWLLLLPFAHSAAQGRGSMQAIDATWKVDSTRRDSVLGVLGTQLQHMGILKSSIPEYHDEQRLPLWSGSVPARNTIASNGQFGPIVNLFASPFLDDFTMEWQLFEHSTRGLLVAVVFVDASGTATSLPPIYQALRLSPGMNCLWLSHPSGGTWSGFISLPNTAGICDRTLPAGRYSPLTVVRTQTAGATIADYPAVARIGESAEGVPLFGVKCLDGWCEFGPRVGPPWALASTPIPTSMPVRQIKGWYDEQWLGQRDATGVVRPLMYAAVFPTRDIASNAVGAFATPVLAGTVVLYADPPVGSKYYAWGLRRGENAFFVQQSGGNWTMRIGSGTSAVLLKAHRMTHMDVGVPGTARWRYISKDDGIWVPCGQACCRVDDS